MIVMMRIQSSLMMIVTLAFKEASDSDSTLEDSISVSADLSHTIDDLTPQQNGDTSEDSHVLSPRDDELPKGFVTHLSHDQTSMIATSNE
jgi:hypothetical protein